MISKIFNYLSKEYNLNFHKRGTDPFFVLIFTVLSARSRDVQTEKVTDALFKIYGTPKKLASAPIKSIEKIIKPIGFYHVKAKRIKQIAIDLIEKYNGKVPDIKEEMMKLPGVGSKTAGCVLVYAFRIPAIPVDTHVHRISHYLGLVKTKTPEQTEIKLMKIIPKSKWIAINELMVKFGQRKCLPIKPWCSKCGLTDICIFYKKNKNSNKIR